MKPDAKSNKKSRDKSESPGREKKDTAFPGKIALVVIIGIIIIAAIFLMINSQSTSNNQTTRVVNMSTVTATLTPTMTPVKSARPSVDLYVMSFCPYGVQAETVMKPVVELLGPKADIQVHYITTVSGTTVSSVKSLHGPSEALEDLRQLCILKSYPEKYWNYLSLFNTQCYPVWQNASSLESCRKNVTTTLDIALTKIDSCSAGTEGLALLKADEADANRNGATASPTLIINGVKYRGSRTPESFKTAICNSFEKAPAECTTILASTSGAAASGGCG